VINTVLISITSNVSVIMFKLDWKKFINFYRLRVELCELEAMQ